MLCIVLMTFSIKFYDKAFFKTSKVCDLITQWMLPSELSSKSISAQIFPKQLFCFCRFSTHAFCFISQIAISVRRCCLVTILHTELVFWHSPSPSGSLPTGEGGGRGRSRRFNTSALPLHALSSRACAPIVLKEAHLP